MNAIATDLCRRKDDDRGDPCGRPVAGCDEWGDHKGRPYSGAMLEDAVCAPLRPDVDVGFQVRDQTLSRSLVVNVNLE